MSWQSSVTNNTQAQYHIIHSAAVCPVPSRVHGQLNFHPGKIPWQNSLKSSRTHITYCNPQYLHSLTQKI